MSDRERSPYWAGVIAITVANLALKLWLAFLMFDREFFFQKNVLFDADPNFYLNRFTLHGFQNHAFVHPTVPFLIGFTVRIVSRLTGPGTRESLALLVSPLASTIQVIVLSAILKKQLRLGDAAGLVLLMISAFGFSGLLMGSMPESFAMSACAITILIWLMLDRTVLSARFRVAAWVMAAMFTVGVTITNAAIVAIACLGWGVLNGRSLRRAVLLAGVLSGGVTVVNIAGSMVAARMLGVAVRPGKTASMYGNWVQLHPLESSARITEAVANTFLPYPPTQMPDSLARPGARYRTRFTYLAPFRLTDLLWCLPTFAMVVLGVVGYRTAAEPGMRAVLLALGGMVAFNYALHLFFGFEVFLYSPHWAPPVLLLIAGMALRRRRWAELLLAGYGAAVVGVSAMRLVDILRMAR